MLRAVLMVMAAASTVSGATVTVERDGLPAGPAEVCRFRAGDGDNPFDRWLSSQELTCADASLPLDFPSGLWNLFARSKDGISTEPLLVDSQSVPATINLALEPAATLAIHRQAGHDAIVYVPALGTAFPVTRGESQVTVPAAQRLWLIALEKRIPVAVVPIPPLERGTVRSADARNAEISAVLGWLEVPAADRETLVMKRGLVPPSVNVGSQSSDPLPPLSRIHGAFVRIAGVDEGEPEVKIGGRGWVPQIHRVRVRPGVTVVPQPLAVRGAGDLVVHWSAADDLPALDASLGSCEPPEKPARFELTISACPPRRAGRREDPQPCAVIHQEEFAPHLRFSSAAVENVPPGTYRAELRFGKLPPIGATGLVRALGVADIRILASYQEVYGTVSTGGDPIAEEAAIEFPGGYGFATGGAGEYRAVLTGPVGADAQITISACDGSPRAIVLTNLPTRRNARYDLDIPGNRLTVMVTDTFTGEALKGASVRFTALSNHYTRRPVMNQTVLTDAGGRVAFTAVPVRDLLLSISLAGYQKRDFKQFSITNREQKTLDIQLVPLRGSRGRIFSERPFEGGAILWFDASGAERERAELANDGTFIYANSHEAGETIAVVSQSHPLWVLRAQATGQRETISLRFPEAPIRSFEVSAAQGAASETRIVTLIVGGIAVPHGPLTQHQFLRGQPPAMRGKGPLPIVDILETGPIEVILGTERKRVGTGAVAVRFD